MEARGLGYQVTVIAEYLLCGQDLQERQLLNKEPLRLLPNSPLSTIHLSIVLLHHVDPTFLEDHILHRMDRMARGSLKNSFKIINLSFGNLFTHTIGIRPKFHELIPRIFFHFDVPYYPPLASVRHSMSTVHIMYRLSASRGVGFSFVVIDLAGLFG